MDLSVVSYNSQSLFKTNLLHYVTQLSVMLEHKTTVRAGCKQQAKPHILHQNIQSFSDLFLLSILGQTVLINARVTLFISFDPPAIPISDVPIFSQFSLFKKLCNCLQFLQLYIQPVKLDNYLCFKCTSFWTEDREIKMSDFRSSEYSDI